MAWKFPTTVSGSGIQIDLGNGVDDLYVAAQVFIASTNTIAVYGSGANHEVRVYGTVAAQGDAIFLGSDSTDTGNLILIEKGARADSISGAGAGVRGSDAGITNRGTLTGNYGAYFDISGADPVDSALVNAGTIEATNYGVYHSGSETLNVSNTGLISSANNAFYSTGAAIDKITNTGKIIGTVNLGDGADIFDSRGGTLKGYVDGGLGADILYGTSGADDFRGGEGADKLYAYDGDDILLGNDGNDYLHGGNGKDKLTGGLGKDDVRGGEGADTFIFLASADSTVASAGRDLILDFSQSQQDKINLKAIDARVSTGVDNSFTFIGKTAYGENEGELRYKIESGITKIYGDTNGDGASDFSIWINSVVTLTAGDFVL